MRRPTHVLCGTCGRRHDALFDCRRNHEKNRQGVTFLDWRKKYLGDIPLTEGGVAQAVYMWREGIEPPMV